MDPASLEGETGGAYFGRPLCFDKIGLKRRVVTERNLETRQLQRRFRKVTRGGEAMGKGKAR